MVERTVTAPFPRGMKTQGKVEVTIQLKSVSAPDWATWHAKEVVDTPDHIPGVLANFRRDMTGVLLPVEVRGLYVDYDSHRTFNVVEG